MSIHLLWYVNTSSVSQSTKIDHLSQDKGRGIKRCHQWSELFCGKIMMLIFSFSTLLQVCSPHKYIDHLEVAQQLVLTELTEMTYLVW